MTGVILIRLLRLADFGRSEMHFKGLTFVITGIDETGLRERLWCG